MTFHDRHAYLLLAFNKDNNESQPSIPAWQYISCLDSSSRGMASGIFTADLAQIGIPGSGASIVVHCRIPHAACPCLRWGLFICNKCSRRPVCRSELSLAIACHQNSSFSYQAIVSHSSRFASHLKPYPLRSFSIRLLPLPGLDDSLGQLTEAP